VCAPLVREPIRDRQLLPGQPGFQALVAALARPNDAQPAIACQAYADGLVQVLARTRTGTYWLEVPHDVCGHYLRQGVDPTKAAFG
jgi:hypothetical protein